MKSEETKQKFVILRASGYSFRKIAAELKISVSTAQDWEDNLWNEIKQYKADELTDLYEQYHATKRQRIKALGDNLTEIEKIMKDKDVFNNLKPGELLNYHIKYLQLLKDAYEPQDPAGRTMAAAFDDFKW